MYFNNQYLRSQSAVYNMQKSRKYIHYFILFSLKQKAQLNHQHSLQSLYTSQIQMNASMQSIRTQHINQYQDIQEIRKIKIYIRTVSRKSIKVELPSQITLQNLKQIIQERLMIAKDKQRLYLKGISLDFNAQILLENNWIIHVIDLDKVKLCQLDIQIKTNSINNQNKENSFTAFPNESLKQFVQRQIISKFNVNLSDLLFVQSGRFLKLYQTFQEQYIQSGTTINMMHSQKDKKKSANVINLNNSVNQQNPQKGNNNTLFYSTGNKMQLKNKYSQIKQINLSNQKNKKASPNNQKTHKINDVKSLPKIQKKQSDGSDSHSHKCSAHNININNGLKSSKSTINQQKSERSGPTNTSSFMSPSKIVVNKSIPIGQRQCQCKSGRKQKQAKFITTEQRKKRQKEIRQQNLQKMMVKKNKEMQQSGQSSPSLTNSERIALKKKTSLNNIRIGDFSDSSSHSFKHALNFNPIKKQHKTKNIGLNK